MCFTLLKAKGNAKAQHVSNIQYQSKKKKKKQYPVDMLPIANWACDFGCEVGSKICSCYFIKILRSTIFTTFLQQGLSRNLLLVLI